VPVFLALFLAPVYVPRNLLGGWVHAVAPFNPVTHVMETIRDLIAGTGSEYLATFGIVAALLTAVFVFAITGLRRAEAAG
jgi:ABC-2 type transport system permease protein